MTEHDDQLEHEEQAEEEPLEEGVSEELSDKERYLLEQLQERDRQIAESQRAFQEMLARETESKQQQNEVSEALEQVNEYERNLKDKLVQAKEEGDTVSEVEYHAQLSELAAKKEKIKEYKRAASAVPVYEEVEPDIPQISQGLQGFYQRCPWADRTSAVYVPHLEQEAANAALTLKNRMVLQGDYNLVDSSEYWEAVEWMVKQNHGIGETHQPRRVNRAPMMGSGTTSGATPNRRSEPVHLTESQVQEALRFKAPPGFTNEQKIEMYRRSLQSLR